MIFAQSVIQHTVNGWEVLLALTIGLPAVVAAVLSYLNGTMIGRTQTSINDSSAKTDVVHGMFNSQLEKWKEQIKEQNQMALDAAQRGFDDAVKIAKAESVAANLADTVRLEKRIAILEATAQLKDVSQAAALASARTAQTVIHIQDPPESAVPPPETTTAEN